MSETINRLSKNTLFLYIRMIALMAITLYTSRVLLATLGITDFGIYSVVGSVTATFYSLRSVFAEAIQRFLNFEKGRDCKEGEKQVFNIAVVLHLIIAVLFILIVEIGGLWLLDSKLVIEPSRMSAAYSVFHLTVVASMFSILIIPFDALIIANERMHVYAWVSILDGIAKLLVVLALVYIPYDNLVTYAVLLAIIPFLNLLIYMVYCRKFPECRYNFRFDRARMKEIFAFSGWSFGGNLFYTIAHEGLNILINMFGGVANNAARNIAYQIRAAVNQISNNTLLATKPFLLQNAASLKHDEYIRLIGKITRVNFFIMLITCMPIICFCQQFLNIWLVDVPNKAVVFTQLITLSVLIRCIHGPLSLFYMGVGKIKRMVFIESFIFAFMLPVCYLILKCGFREWSVYAILVIVEALIVLSLTLNIQYEFKTSVKDFFTQCLLPCTLLLIISCAMVVAIQMGSLKLNLLYFLGALLCMLIVQVLLVFLFMNKEEKKLLGKIVLKFLKK